MKPKVTSEGERELEKADAHFKEFDQSVQKMTLDHMNQAPLKEIEPQTKLSKAELDKAPDVYLKPNRSIGSKEKFNEDYREQWQFAKEYVGFVAENNMIIGEQIEMWTKPFAGMPAEFWKIPVNKKVYAPRYVAEQIKRARHHTLTMKENTNNGTDYAGQYYGSMTVENVVQRLDAKPVSNEKSIFMSR